MAKKFSKLTRAATRTLKKPGRQITEHGITFTRMPDGDGHWSVNIMVDGQRIHRVLGRESDNVKRQQAEDYIAKLRTDARENRLNLPKRRKVAWGFKEAATKYLSLLEQEGGCDIERKRQRLGSHLTPFFKAMPLTSIKTTDIERYKKSRLEAGASHGTVNRELAVISHMLHKSVDWAWIDYASAKIIRLKENASKFNYLSKEESDRILTMAKLDQNPHIYLFILIGLRTGMRKNEILSIRFSDIDTEKRMIYIPRAKAGARNQPITTDLALHLSTLVNAAGGEAVWLFPSERTESGHIEWIEKPFRRVVEAAGLDPTKIVRHTLRHTAITHLVQAGVDIPTVQRISGHKTPQMVHRYAHQSGEHIGEAMDKLLARYENPLQGG